jgi:hypothetical protein
MSGVLLVPVSGEVLGPLNRAMTFQIDAQGVHQKCCAFRRGNARQVVPAGLLPLELAIEIGKPSELEEDGWREARGLHCRGQRRNGIRKKSMRSARWLPGYAFVGCDMRPFTVETQACRPRAFAVLARAGQSSGRHCRRDLLPGSIARSSKHRFLVNSLGPCGWIGRTIPSSTFAGVLEKINDRWSFDEPEGYQSALAVMLIEGMM